MFKTELQIKKEIVESLQCISFLECCGGYGNIPDSTIVEQKIRAAVDSVTDFLYGMEYIVQDNCIVVSIGIYNNGHVFVCMAEIF